MSFVEDIEVSIGVSKLGSPPRGGSQMSLEKKIDNSSNHHLHHTNHQRQRRHIKNGHHAQTSFVDQSCANHPKTNHHTKRKEQHSKQKNSRRRKPEESPHQRESTAPSPLPPAPPRTPLAPPSRPSAADTSHWGTLARTRRARRTAGGG